MFTLILVYLADEKLKMSVREAVQSPVIPQIGSVLSGGRARFGTFKVAMVAHDVGGGSLSSEVYVYLADALDGDEPWG